MTFHFSILQRLKLTFATTEFSNTDNTNKIQYTTAMESVPFDEKEPIKVETEPDTAEITLTESGQIEISDTPKSVSSTQKVINALHGVVVPKAQPIKFHHFVGLSIYSAIP